MGTTALTYTQRVAKITATMNFFIILSTASLVTSAPAPHGIHPVVSAVVPVTSNQWPGITDGNVDTTCYGCRQVVVAPVPLLRKVREADPAAEPEAEPHVVVPGLLGHPYLPLHATALLGSSSYQTVDNNGAAYTTGVTAVHPVLIPGRRKRGAEAEAEAEAEPASALLPAQPLSALNGYAHSLESGDSFVSISTPNLYNALPHHIPAFHVIG